MEKINTVQQKGRAKINLMLDVRNNREDGFHEVSMIMQSLRLWDSIRISLLDERSEQTESDRVEGGSFSGNIPFLKADDKNIAWKAWKAMREKYHLKQDVHIHLYKKIPIAAGLAGGSTDAAAVIRGVNRLFDLNRPRQELMELGAQLGSDVPFCIQGGTCLAYGRGEKLLRVTPLPMTYVVLIKPDFSISTRWSYEEFDTFQEPPHPDWHRMDESIASGDISKIQSAMGNNLELPALRSYPVIGDLKTMLLEKGADASAMSGSGPTVFGLFKEERSAREAYHYLKSCYPNYQVILTSTENPVHQQGGEWK